MHVVEEFPLVKVKELNSACYIYWLFSVLYVAYYAMEQDWDQSRRIHRRIIHQIIITFLHQNQSPANQEYLESRHGMILKSPIIADRQYIYNKSLRCKNAFGNAQRLRCVCFVQAKIRHKEFPGSAELGKTTNTDILLTNAKESSTG